MNMRTNHSVLALGLLVGWLSSSSLAQAPAAAGGGTLWHFLGIPQGARYVRDQTFNRNGNRPGLERKPPLKPIGDPKNLESPDASIKKAAEVKQAEDLKKQKIKAIKYLASIGCGCYNRDGSITDAMLKSMDDCTEEVRLATVQSISEAAMGERCANCKQKSCCSEELSNKLYEIAYGRDDEGCYLEPSERVRLAAAEALRTCCESRGDDMMFMDPSASPTPAMPGGEQPNIVPEVGGERPADVPPGLINPGLPAPPATIPLQNPAPIVPPAGAPPAPAPAAAREIPSSRRTAAMNAQPGQPIVSSTGSVVARSAMPAKPELFVQPAPMVKPVVIAPATEQTVRVNPHWKPSDEPSVFVRSAAGGALPSEDPTVRPTPENVVVTSLPQRKGVVAHTAKFDATMGLAPIVSRASMTRLPPVDVSQQHAASSPAVPAPPLPTAAPVVSPVSMSRPQSILVEPAGSTRDSGPAPVLTNRDPAQPAAKKQTRAMPRQLPGSQFGSGTISSVRIKEGTAIVSFETAQSVPAGSIIRAYHYYALTGKKPACDLIVVEGGEGQVTAIPNGSSRLTDLSVGDQAVVLQ